MHSLGKINYQARFEKLFREFSDLERLADAQDQFLRLILRRIFFAIDRAYPQLARECGTIRAQLHQASDGLLPLERLRPLTERLAERIRDIEAIQPASEKVPESDDPVLSVRSALILLIDQIAFSQGLQERQDELRSQLHVNDDPTSDTILIDRTAALINDMHNLDEREKTDLLGFLRQTAQKLSAIDQYALVGLDQIQSDRDAQIQLNTAAKQQIDHMSASVSASTDLAELQQSMQHNLLQISERFDQLRAREEAHLQKAEQEIRVMQHHIAQLQNETRVLHGQLRTSLHHLLHDPLTGLPNELALHKRLQREVGRTQRVNAPLCLAQWEIDDFRDICSRCGRQVGEKLLHSVGKNLSNLIRKNDMAARLRGEEFVLLLPEVGADQARPMVDAMRRKLSATTFRFKGEALHITVSCGLAQHQPGQTVETLLERADQALAQSKARGRNHCTVV